MKKLTYLLLILTLNFACAENQRTSNKEPVNQSNVTDTLKFTSGIRAIFQDSKGNYWFGSLQEGVALYDGNSLTYFTTYQGLSDNQVRSIQEDKYGNIWIGTAHGISSYDGILMTRHNQIEIGDSLNEWIKTDNDLWFNAGINEGIYRYDGQNLSYLAFPDPKVINSHNIYCVTDISHGKDNMLWISTYPGVYGYNGETFTIINDETLDLKKETGELHIRSILEDSKGRLWIGNNGIGVLLQENDTIINFSEKHNLMHPNSSLRSTSQRGDKSQPGTLEHVFTISEDGNGNIWFGDRDAGIWKYDGNTMTNYTKNDELTNDFAQSIYEDNSGQLWFGMRDGSVFTFNGKTFEKRF